MYINAVNMCVHVEFTSGKAVASELLLKCLPSDFFPKLRLLQKFQFAEERNDTGSDAAI